MKIFIKTKKSFTLIEILIISSLIGLLITILLINLNPRKQIEKSQDAKRKAELNQLQKALEDWINDKGCYPRPNEICYNQVLSNNTCYICGNESGSPSFSPYLQSLPCDPQHPAKKYLYQVDDIQCPKKFWIYAKLSNELDPLINELKCTAGCGPGNDFSYNIGLSSPNTSINFQPTSPATPTNIPRPTNTPIPTPTRTPTPTTTPAPTPTPQIRFCVNYANLYVINNFICNNCGNYQQCMTNHPEKTFYINNNCSVTCQKTNMNNKPIIQPPGQPETGLPAY